MHYRIDEDILILFHLFFHEIIICKKKHVCVWGPSRFTIPRRKAARLVWCSTNPRSSFQRLIMISPWRSLAVRRTTPVAFSWHGRVLYLKRAPCLFSLYWTELFEFATSATTHTSIYVDYWKHKFTYRIKTWSSVSRSKATSPYTENLVPSPAWPGGAKLKGLRCGVMQSGHLLLRFSTVNGPKVYAQHRASPLESKRFVCNFVVFTYALFGFSSSAMDWVVWRMGSWICFDSWLRLAVRHPSMKRSSN